MNRVRKQLHLDDIDLSFCNHWGIYVAVLDSGIDVHPDFTGRIVAFKDFVNKKDFFYDDCGHGTHVSGIIGSSGKASNGYYRGIATQVKYIVGKVLNKEGEGNTEKMIEGLRWVLSLLSVYPIRIVNISVSMDDKSVYERIRTKENVETILSLLDELWSRGVFVITAAGNGGMQEHTMSKLGSREPIVMVGCHDGFFQSRKGDVCFRYSGRGPVDGTIIKPDIVAPGTDIISCKSNYGWKGHKKKKWYVKKSGTSMAAPIVSGTVALYMQKYPNDKIDIIRRKLLESATDLGEARNAQGYGMINPVAFLNEHSEITKKT